MLTYKCEACEDLHPVTDHFKNAGSYVAAAWMRRSIDDLEAVRQRLERFLESGAEIRTARCVERATGVRWSDVFGPSWYTYVRSREFCIGFFNTVVCILEDAAEVEESSPL